jgi:D-alanyl-D-alanine dipeptidase
MLFSFSLSSSSPIMQTNLGKSFFLFRLVFLILSTVYLSASSQTIKTVNSFKEYQRLTDLDSNKRMISLSSIQDIKFDLRYATSNNFVHRPMYSPGTKRTFLRLPAAIALKNAAAELSAKGFGLKIFDAYRPYSVTVKFWELVKDERYVANPAKGSGHNRGIAVDLTIYDLKTGKEIDMGTGFDNFTDTAHSDFKALPEKVLQDRQLLRSTMEKYGFKVLQTEWWHFYLPESDRFEVLDIDIEKFGKKIN